ncbi:MAG: GNAT family N-acetyltransferase [Oscillospiraceae bacterium]
MTIREYEPSDCETLARLFYDTVHSVNIKDYTDEQVSAWATGEVDLTAWNNSFLEHFTVVAEDDGVIVGFGDIAENGYLDRLYVHKDCQHNGIGTAICDKLEKSVNSLEFTVHASITAKPFFESRGYTVVKEQQVVRMGVFLTNFYMKKRK